jgi:hypothetical protein
VEEDEAPDPGDVGFFGADGIVFAPDGLMHLVEELFGSSIYLPPLPSGSCQEGGFVL